WAGYAVVTALGAYTHLTMICVAAAQALVAASVLVLESRGSAAAERPSRRLGCALGFGGAAFLVVLAYAPLFPELIAVTATEGRHGVASDWVRPRWAAGELWSGLANAFTAAALGGAALLLGLAGIVRLGRESPRVAALWVLPVVLVAVVS